MTVIPAAPVRVDVRPRPLERLEAEIVTLETQLTAATARFITLVGEFDAAEGWRDWGMRSTAHWLSWKCGVSLHTAREQVRVARALRALPLVTAAFEAGRLSYSKVRAVTRFVCAEDEADVVEIAECATAAQIDALAAGMRRARTAGDVRRRHAARYFSYRYDDDGTLVGSFRLSPGQAAVFLHGLDAARGRIQPLGSEGEPAATHTSSESPGQVPAGTSVTANVPAGTSPSRRCADALVAMAEHYLTAAAEDASPAAAERFQLVIHTSAEALAVADAAGDDHPTGSTLADGTRLHPSTARRLACDCPSSTLTVDADDHPLHIGRRHRRIRGRLLRAVHARDRGRCRAPGCTVPASQIHHIRHWANGGPTCLANLISLCDAHHWAVHEGGFAILPRSNTWALISPAGVTVEPVPAPPAQPVSPLPHKQDLRDDAVSGTWDGTDLDVGYTTGLLNAPAAAPARSACAEAPFDRDAIIAEYLANLEAMDE